MGDNCTQFGPICNVFPAATSFDGVRMFNLIATHRLIQLFTSGRARPEGGTGLGRRPCEIKRIVE